MSVIRFTAFVCLAVIAATPGYAAELRRRAMLGFSASLADTARPPDPATNPVRVVNVLPGTAAADSGLAPGDAIVSVDGVPIREPLEVSSPKRYAGDTVRLVISRNGQEIEKTLAPKPRPLETSPIAEVLYRAVEVNGAQRRVIVTRPRSNGRFPAVIVMGGLGCYSLDSINRAHGYGRVIAALEEKGYVTVRVEKAGEGDSDGPACSSLEATAELEAAGYIAAIQAAKQYNFVDPARIYAFAHSMGPLIGALVVAREPLAGMMAIETIGTSWFEYDVERYRYQMTMTGRPADEVDQMARDYDRCSYRFYIAKETPEKILATPSCRGFFDPLNGVPYTYMHQVADISLAKQWKQADIPVLVVYGTASTTTSDIQSRYLADTINNLHPGRATYVEVPGMGHDLARYESKQDQFRATDRASRPFHTGLLEAMFNWLEKV